MSTVIKVGMADLKVAKAPDILQTCGLGSCVGICLWDAATKVAGMAHIMLPDSSQSKSQLNQAKFADTAIILLIESMLELGCHKTRLVAKIAGGAQMFSFYGKNDIMRIGERNAEAVKVTLQKERIRLLAQDTGGNYGRTIEFSAVNGQLLIKTINVGESII
jgi:chemotaxis protein CheD